MTFTWFDLLVLSLVTYRVTRFTSLDSLIEEPRNWAEKKLLAAGFYTQDGEDWPVGFWRRKALQWIRCPYCQSVWFAMATYLFWFWWGDTLVGEIVLYPLALAGAAMMWYRFTDPSPPCLPTKECD